MQTLPFQQNTGFNTGALIKRNQQREADHDAIRLPFAPGLPLRARMLCRHISSMSGASRVARRSRSLMISAVPDRSFRYLDNPAESERYREYVRLLTPAIMAVLPLEFRHRLMPQDDILSRLSSAMKECAEAKQAVMLNAPEHQKLKEVSEGITSLFRLMPEQTGALMTIVSSMLGVM